MAKIQNVDIDKVGLEGPGLVFIGKLAPIFIAY